MTENHPTAGCPEPDLVRSVEDMQIQPSDLGLIARVAALGKRYGHGDGSVTALDDVSLGLRRGEFTAIMGPSGSGKSTLMHIMAGLDSPTSGRVWLGDTDITQLSDSALTVLRRRRIGFVFQSFNLVPTLDVQGNVLLPFELDGRRRGSTYSSTPWASATACGTVRTSSRAGSSSASPSRGHLPRAPTSSSPTSRPGISTPARGVRSSGCWPRRAPATVSRSRW
jgi:ABC-type glutathione transport system ATPase component